MSAAPSARIRPGRGAAAVLLALSVIGCQGKGEVSGKVVYQDKALASGTVLIVASDGSLHQGTIKTDGSYRIRDVPSGEARLAVNSPDPDRQLVRKAEPPPPDPETLRRQEAVKARWFPIPPKYGDPNTSGLTMAVKSGSNPHDIGLE